MNRRWLIIVVAAVAVVSTVLVYVISTYVPPPPPYSGPVIYATLPAENGVVAIQAGPSVSAAFSVLQPTVDVALSPSGATLYAASSNGVLVVDTATGTYLPATLPTSVLKQMVVSNDGKTLYVAPLPGNTHAPTAKAVLAFHLPSGAATPRKYELDAIPHTLALSRNGNSIFVGTDTGRFIAVDVANGATRADIDIGELPIKIVNSPANVALYVLDASSRITVLDPASYQPVETIQAGPGATDLAVTGTRLLVADGSARTVWYFDAVTRASLGAVDAGPNLERIRIDPITDRAYVVERGPRNAILILNAKVPELIDAIPTNEPYYFLELAPDRGQAFALAPYSVVKVLDLRWLSSGRELARMQTGQFPAAISLHAATQRAYVSNLLGRSLSVIDTATRTLVETLPTQFYPAQLIVDASGQHVYGTTQGGSVPQLWILDVASRTFSTIELDAPGGGLAFSPNGDFLFVTLSDKNVVAVVSVLTREVINTISTDAGPIDLAIASFRGIRQLYVANAAARTVTIYPAIPGATRIATLQLNATPLALKTPPDGKEVLILYSNNSMQKVDGASGNLHGLRPIDGAPMYLAASPDGGWIYTSNLAGPIQALHRDEAFVTSPFVLSPSGTRWIAVQP